MTLTQTTLTLQNWLHSCTRHEQIELFKDVIEKFINQERFPNADQYDLIYAKLLLVEDMSLHSLSLAQKACNGCQNDFNPDKEFTHLLYGPKDN